MLRCLTSVRKKYRVRYRSVFSILLIVVFVVPVLGVFAGDTFVPAVPSGPLKGYVGISYEYVISTSNPDASWLFDWGDESDSGWLQLESDASSIKQEHIWDSCGVFSVRVMYRSDYFPEGVWSDSIEVVISDICERDYPSIPIISGFDIGLTGSEYDFSVVSTSFIDGLVQYRMDWGDGIISDWSGLVLFDVSVGFKHIWEEPSSYDVVAQALNSYGLVSDYSEIYTITIESDSDADGLSDSVESDLGSSVSDSSDVSVVVIDSSNYYIVSLNAVDIVFYDYDSNTKSSVDVASSGLYQLDVDFDSSWDYFYDPASGSISAYVEEESMDEGGLLLGVPWWWFGILIVCIVLCVVFFLFKTGVLVVYEEYVVEE